MAPVSPLQPEKIEENIASAGAKVIPPIKASKGPSILDIAVFSIKV
jgi:hypothetical protein